MTTRKERKRLVAACFGNERIFFFIVITGHRIFPLFQNVYAREPFTFDLSIPTIFKYITKVRIMEQMKGHLANLDKARDPMAFHSGGYIDSITPEIVVEFGDSYNTSYNRPGMDANPTL